MKSGIDLFLDRLNSIDVHLTDIQLNQFQLYYEYLIEQNKVMNLTAITDYEDVLLKHFVDCLAVNIVPYFKSLTGLDKVCNIIDIGTGAGFPGVPLKIAFPDLKTDLLDSLNKRINFLNTLIRNISLENISAYHGRAEDFAFKPEFREHYDLCVSRAVANLSTLCEYCLPFIRQDGIFIALKSGEIDEELQLSKKAISILGGAIIDVINYTLPQSDIERSFVIIKKISLTPKKYPRKAGIPAKDPIK